MHRPCVFQDDYYAGCCPAPPDEAARLAALHKYAVLDTSAESAFDDAVSLASAICATPIALVSLIDEIRQWFKARIGLGAQETPPWRCSCSILTISRTTTTSSAMSLAMMRCAALPTSNRVSDLVARYGGEEFVMVLPETTLEGSTPAGGALPGAH